MSFDEEEVFTTQNIVNNFLFRDAEKCLGLGGNTMLYCNLYTKLHVYERTMFPCSLLHLVLTLPPNGKRSNVNNTLFILYLLHFHWSWRQWFLSKSHCSLTPCGSLSSFASYQRAGEGGDDLENVGSILAPS